MSLSSQLALEDVGGLLLGPLFLTADPMGPLLDQDEEEALSPSSSLSSQGRAPPSPPLSFSSSSYASSPFSSSSTPPPSPPPPFHPSFPESKAGADILSLPWLGEGDLLDAHVGLDGGKEDAFSGMDWMTEKIDLSDFDLESLMGSCSPGNPPSSPEELLASLESQLDLEPYAALPAQPGVLDLGLPLAHVPLDIPLPEEEMAEEEPVPEVVEWKTEPRSPAPLSPAPLSPAPLSPAPSPLSPAFTLELGSEVDVLEVDKITTTTTIIPEAGLQTVATPILLSLQRLRKRLRHRLFRLRLSRSPFLFSSAPLLLRRLLPHQALLQTLLLPLLRLPQGEIGGWRGATQGGGEEAEEDGAEQDGGHALPSEEEGGAGRAEHGAVRAGEQEPRAGGEGRVHQPGDPVPQGPDGRGPVGQDPAGRRPQALRGAVVGQRKRPCLRQPGGRGASAETGGVASHWGWRRRSGCGWRR